MARVAALLEYYALPLKGAGPFVTPLNAEAGTTLLSHSLFGAEIMTCPNVNDRGFHMKEALKLVFVRGDMTQETNKN